MHAARIFAPSTIAMFLFGVVSAILLAVIVRFFKKKMSSSRAIDPKEYPTDNSDSSRTTFPNKVYEVASPSSPNKNKEFEEMKAEEPKSSL